MKTPLFLLLTAACFPCGYWLGGGLTPGEPSGTETEAAAAGPAAKAEGSPAPAPSLRRDAGRVAEALAESFRGGAEGLAASLRSVKEDPVRWSALMTTWRKKDPARLLRTLAALAEEEPLSDASTRYRFLAREVINEIAMTDPRAAASEPGALEDASLRHDLMTMTVIRALMTDPAGAVELALANPEIPFDHYPKYGRPESISADLLPKIRQLGPGRFKEELLAKALIDNFSPADAMAETEKEDGRTREQVALAVAWNFVEKDFEGAKALALSSESLPTSAALRLAVGKALASSDPAAAVTWADENLSGPYKKRVLEQAADSLVKTSPAAAEEIRARLPEK